ncbi:valine--tRNA ligase [candidate division KSB1 bacterium]|nr:valine--tRNA ligase [candidate division KSB1 bacterium]
MSTPDIPKTYDPRTVESKWFQHWLDNRYFHADESSDRPTYSIVIPPPNVTSVLHMGHAYNNTVQDIFIRFHKMLGYNTLWMPGTDHAGIATQNVVERFLKKEENLTRHDLGREKFVERVWEWKHKHGNIIIEQLQKMGCACDWERERFTMDDGLSRAVVEVFYQLYEKGLIYRGEYIINWCPRCETALSDEEAIHDDREGKLWHIKYPIKDSDQYVIVATTRPETMLGDTAVAVNPSDKRYTKLVGKTIILPIMNREIPIIADEYVDSEFGTGAVKVTPAHDPNDFEMGKRHNLPFINVMNGNGTMNENAGHYNRMTREKCREGVVDELETAGLLEKIEKHNHSVAHCQRCDTTVEPYLSRQWFVKAKPLAKPALKAVLDGDIKIHPEKWIKVYQHWMENIRDWCISRQLWWGHRIPVYYCQDCNHMMVLREAPTTCEKCQSTNIYQDEDVLDTWFSSWLWPFSTMGWPEKTATLEKFYPTSVLVTAPDIIFFWVARMVMAGMEFMGEIPFHFVYFNGLIRDDQGRKMSKSLGNGIDPLAMIDQYSADSVRFSLLMLTAEGQDINLAESSFEIGRNFCNKLWNAFRMLGMHLNEDIREFAASENVLNDTNFFEVSDIWILSRYHKTIDAVTVNLKAMKLNDAVSSLYGFFWREFCDWYLELIKPRLYSDDPARKRFVLGIALYILRGILKLLHPIVPFITEEIWNLVKLPAESDIIIAEWPVHNPSFFHDDIEQEMTTLQAVIGAIRNIRGEMNIPPSKRATLCIKSPNGEFFHRHAIVIRSLAQVDGIDVAPDLTKPKFSASAVLKDIEIFIPLEGLIDIGIERSRMQKEIIRLEKQIEGTEKKLLNKDFLGRAPKDVIERERLKSRDFQDNLEKLRVNLKSLSDV